MRGDFGRVPHNALNSARAVLPIVVTPPRGNGMLLQNQLKP